MRSIICYIPNESRDNDINFICSDNKVHVRFKDYKKAAVIAGFEQKLTYLITYLMNYSYLQSTLVSYDADKLIKGFLLSDDVDTINACIRDASCSTKYRGLKLRKRVMLDEENKANYKPFGDVKLECFPTFFENEIAKAGNLNFFLSSFRISLRDYLFNDNYIIIIDDIDTTGINKKFINKMIRKADAVSGNNLDIVELW